jgi:succinate dehydrogenase flavin-adding protein (antitoxin of CptAB toxin-antitoxin module)
MGGEVMFSPRAIHHLIKYLNSIDKKLSNYLTRKRPWDEELLTRMFCDLLDQDYQEEENIDYTLNQLYSDLLESDDPIAINISIETRQYTKHYEHNVTKSDIGLILEYQDQFN